MAPKSAGSSETETPNAQAYLILLTSRDTSADLVAGLEAGADDYLVKPFDPAKLRARVRVDRQALFDAIERHDTGIDSFTSDDSPE